MKISFKHFVIWQNLWMLIYVLKNQENIALILISCFSTSEIYANDVLDT